MQPSFHFTAALHNYLHVDDVRTAAVAGLSGVTYADKVQNGVDVLEQAAAVTITGETDRIYRDAPRDLHVEHAHGTRSIDLHSANFGDWIVWNPWAELTATLTDMEPDDYLHMLCVEAGHVSQPVTLLPGETWTGTQILSVSVP